MRAAGAMVDWIDALYPLQHDISDRGPFYAGDVISVTPSHDEPRGFKVDFHVMKRMRVEGSYSQAIMVQSRTHEQLGNVIRISGNPAKYFQGHNIFGSADLPRLAVDMARRVCSHVGIEPSDGDLSMWAAGHVRLMRVDCTASHHLGSVARVRDSIRALSNRGNLEHRGRGSFYGDSIVFGEGSRHQSVTAYAKGPELVVKGHGLPVELAPSPLLDYAQGLLRLEVRTLGMKLEAEQLRWVHQWGDNTASELLKRVLGGLHIAEASMIESDVIAGLTPRLQLAYSAWQQGQDLRAILPRNTFYRYRTELLKHGVDLAVRQERTGPDLSNVVPLRTTWLRDLIHSAPAPVPEWALGTPLYYEPQGFSAAA